MSGSSSDAESSSAQKDSILEQFKNVTGTNNDSARAILEACNWNLELAINMAVDGIESNDMGEMPANPSSNSLNSAAVAAQLNNSDFVRAPIPPVREQLVDDNFSSVIMPTRRLTSAVFDSFRDFQSEARWQEQLQAASSNGENSQDQATISKKQTLEDLYRPPLDIMFRGSLEACKDEGTKLNKWLLVNVQNSKEFACQVLNRDVWSNSTVKDIVKEHFIFWQIYHEQAEGQRYIQFYNVHEYPHVSILDPRTGEKLRTFSIGDADSLCEFITEFINEHPTPNGKQNHASQTPSSSSSAAAAGSSSHRDSISKKIYDQSEEAQLEAAIQASLREISSGHDKKEDEDSSSSIDCQVYEDAQCEEREPENYKDFLAPEDGNNAQIKIRFPDGSFDQISFPASSQIKALFLYISSKGYDLNKFDLTTPYPKRTLNDLKSSDTLAEAGLTRTTVQIHPK